MGINLSHTQRAQAGRISQNGEIIKTDDYEFVILEADKRGIKKVRIRNKAEQV